MAAGQSVIPGRPAWVEVDLGILGSNLRLIRADLPPSVSLMHVIKDEAYGAGAVPVARVALACGVDRFATYTVAEGVALRNAGIEAPILLLGERTSSDFAWLCSHRLTPCVGSVEIAEQLEAFAAANKVVLDVHVKVNSGMNRYGFDWRLASQWAPRVANLRHLRVAGTLTHFAQSDELDKRFALQQLGGFHEALRAMRDAGLSPDCIHACNSGGLLDLPQAHHDMVRVGILALGVYPSAVCRRIPGLAPVLSVKASITALQTLQPGDVVGYGMHYRAESRRRIAVLPIGYGDGYPRVRNEGHALLHGQRVPLVGGVSMDALTVDVTDVKGAALGDEVVLMGRQGEEDITPHELAALKRSVSYDILTSWRARLPRRHLGGAP